MITEPTRPLAENFPHRDTCTDRTLRTTVDALDRSRARTRCLGCGRSVDTLNAAGGTR